MKPIKFSQANSTLAGGPAKQFGTDMEVQDLPVYRGGGEIISLWRPTPGERLSLLFRGRLWLRVWSPGTHPPVSVETAHPWGK